jgi:hypothetical protein
VNGFYAAYLTGNVGNSMALFIFQDGKITGVDVGGMHYDGIYEIDQSAAVLRGTMTYVIKPGGQLITGATAGSEPIKVSFPLELPVGLADGRVLAFSSPSGVVNARFEKLRDL